MEMMYFSNKWTSLTHKMISINKTSASWGGKSVVKPVWPGITSQSVIQLRQKVEAFKLFFFWNYFPVKMQFTSQQFALVRLNTAEKEMKVTEALTFCKPKLQLSVHLTSLPFEKKTLRLLHLCSLPACQSHLISVRLSSWLDRRAEMSAPGNFGPRFSMSVVPEGEMKGGPDYPVALSFTCDSSQNLVFVESTLPLAHSRVSNGNAGKRRREKK